MGVDYYTGLLDRQYAGRRWIITVEAAAAASGFVQRIITAGAEAVMVIAGNEGTGTQPDGAEVYVVGTSGSTIMDGIRAFAAVINHPSVELCAAVDSFDPRREATVLSDWIIPTGEVCGRPVFAPARPEWKALEDKLIVDELWDRAGVERAPSAIVDPNDVAAVDEARQRVGGADGAVIVADNTEGWHGGAEYARYLAPGADASGTLRFFVEHARRVRIMPFLRGVPGSIHGMVTSETVLAFRPVEMLVYRRAASDEFVYAGMNTVWDPPPTIRDQMRAAVRAVGSLIRDEVGYRGGFGIDGVHTTDGFLPTELNPRLTPGLGLQVAAAGGYPIGDINRAVIAGLDLDLRLPQLEDEIVSGADATRAGRWIRPLTHLSVTETVEQAIAWDGSSWRPAGDDEATATMFLGPSAQGAFVRVNLVEDHGVPAGPSIAGVAAASFAVADELWDTRIGDLIPGTVSLA